MTGRRLLILVLASAMQLLAWREAVPVCASMARCGGMPEVSSHCDRAATISGTADCCKSGSVEVRPAVSPLPQRIHSATPALAVTRTASPPTTATLRVGERATAEASPPLPPLLGRPGRASDAQDA